MDKFLDQLKRAALKKDTIPHPLSGADVSLREAYLAGQLVLRAVQEETATASDLATAVPFRVLCYGLSLSDSTLPDLASYVMDMDDDTKLAKLNQLATLMDTTVKKLLFLGDMVRVSGF